MHPSVPGGAHGGVHGTVAVAVAVTLTVCCIVNKPFEERLQNRRGKGVYVLTTDGGVEYAVTVVFGEMLRQLQPEESCLAAKPDSAGRSRRLLTALTGWRQMAVPFRSTVKEGVALRTRLVQAAVTVTVVVVGVTVLCIRNQTLVIIVLYDKHKVPVHEEANVKSEV